MVRRHAAWLIGMAACAAVSVAGLVGGPLVAGDDQPHLLAVGDEAVDFELMSLDEKKEKLSRLVEAGPVVLIVLRGHPGYQCPLCDKQVGQFLLEAERFRQAGAQVVMVYPGAASDLPKHAAAFMKGKKLPGHFRLLLDPDYEFTNAWRLRWRERNETAYPSTFVVNQQRKILFAKVSKSHGGRAAPDEVLAVLEPE